MVEPNALLDALLDEAGMSHAGLAARVNASARADGRASRYDHRSVGRWLQGQRPRGRTPDYICAALAERLRRPLCLEDVGMGRGDTQAPALDGFVEKAAALWRSDQQRPTLSEAPAVVGLPAIAPVWEWENPPEDRDVSRQGAPRVGETEVAVLRTARIHYERMYRQVGGVATRARVVGFLNARTAPLLRGCYSDATGRDLYRAAGGLAAVAGICAYDSDAQGLAQRYFHHALRLAKASGDRGFGGYVIALLVNQAIFLRDYRQAIAFAEAGLRTAGPHITPALRTDLHVMQAKAFARMGSVGDAHRCMTLAEAAAATIRRENEPPETGYVEPGLVEAQLADTLMTLGDFTPAREYAQEAVRTQAHARGRVHRLATLTTVDLNRGEVEQAAATALATLDQAQGMESKRLRERLVSLRDRLSVYRTPEVRDAVGRIGEALAVPL